MRDEKLKSVLTTDRMWLRENRFKRTGKALKWVRHIYAGKSVAIDENPKYIIEVIFCESRREWHCRIIAHKEFWADFNLSSMPIMQKQEYGVPLDWSEICGGCMDIGYCVCEMTAEKAVRVAVRRAYMFAHNMFDSRSYNLDDIAKWFEVGENYRGM